MKKIKCLLTLTTLFAVLISCKKDKLTGDNKVLVGSWTSISTLANCGFVIGQPYNPKLKLELKEKGTYKLFRDNKKVETGRTLVVNGLVTFECSEKNSELNGRKILKFNSDTLNIDRNGCDDDYQFRFKKN